MIFPTRTIIRFLLRSKRKQIENNNKNENENNMKIIEPFFYQVIDLIFRDSLLLAVVVKPQAQQH